jgi:hypothetical protein
VIDDLIVHGPAKQRMRMSDHRRIRRTPTPPDARIASVGGPVRRTGIQ